MFHQSRKTARATMGAIGLLALLFLLSTFGSVEPALAASSLHDASPQSYPQTTANLAAGYWATHPGTYTIAAATFTVPPLQKTVDWAKVAYAAAILGGSGSIIDGGIYSYWDPTLGQINKAYWEFNSASGWAKGEIPLGGGNGGGRVSIGDSISVTVTANSKGDTFIITDMKTGDRGYFIIPRRRFVTPHFRGFSATDVPLR